MRERGEKGSTKAQDARRSNAAPTDKNGGFEPLAGELNELLHKAHALAVCGATEIGIMHQTQRFTRLVQVNANGRQVSYVCL